MPAAVPDALTVYVVASGVVPVQVMVAASDGTTYPATDAAAAARTNARFRERFISSSSPNGFAGMGERTKRPDCWAARVDYPPGDRCVSRSPLRTVSTYHANYHHAR